MLVVKLRPPYGLQPLGGLEGTVNWGKAGENLIDIPYESNNARFMRQNPLVYRLVNAATNVPVVVVPVVKIQEIESPIGTASAPKQRKSKFGKR
jgi:hypothetical protein